MKELEKLVYQALGEASMCWSQVPKGIFQSNKAVEIGEKLIKAIQALSQSENKPITKEEIEYRIKEEFKKHKELDWAKIAASKIYALLPQPPKLNNHENN